MSTDKARFYAHQIDRMLDADKFLLYAMLKQYVPDLPKVYEMFELGEFIQCESNPFNSADVSYQIVHGQFNLADPYFTVIDEGEHGSLYSFDEGELGNFVMEVDLITAIMDLTDDEMKEISSCGLHIEPYEEHVEVPLSLLERILHDYEAVDRGAGTWLQPYTKDISKRIKQAIEFNTED